MAEGGTTIRGHGKIWIYRPERRNPQMGTANPSSLNHHGPIQPIDHMQLVNCGNSMIFPPENLLSGLVVQFIEGSIWINGLSPTMVCFDINDISFWDSLPLRFTTSSLTPVMLLPPTHPDLEWLPTRHVNHFALRRWMKTLAFWLVVGPPLWKILVNWDDYSQYMGK